MNIPTVVVNFNDNSAVSLLYAENTGLSATRGTYTDDVFEPTHTPDDFLFDEHPHLIPMWTEADGWNQDTMMAFLFGTPSEEDDTDELPEVEVDADLTEYVKQQLINGGAGELFEYFDIEVGFTKKVE